MLVAHATDGGTRAREDAARAVRAAETARLTPGNAAPPAADSGASGPAPAAGGAAQGGLQTAATTAMVIPPRVTKPMQHQREKDLDAEIRQKLANRQPELDAYERMLKSRAFQKADVTPIWERDPGQAAQARIALLEQVRNTPEAGVIDNLSRLGDRAWYDRQGFEDQQRTAKVTAYNSSSSTPNANDARRNTVNYILSNDKLELNWKNLQHGTTTTYGQAGDSGILWWQHPEISLNRNTVPAGDGPLKASDRAALRTGVETLAHEVNHLLTPGGNEKSYAYFMDEYRAWYVGYKAQNGHPPSAAEAYERAQYLTTSKGPYDNIAQALDDQSRPDSKQIKDFMARLMGLDPATATVTDVKDASKFRGGIGDAAAPVSTGPKDPNNLDNRH